MHMAQGLLTRYPGNFLSGCLHGTAAFRAGLLVGVVACLLVLGASLAPAQSLSLPDFPPLIQDDAQAKQPVAFKLYLYSGPQSPDTADTPDAPDSEDALNAPGTPDAGPRRPLLVLWLEPAPGYYSYAHIPQPTSKPTNLDIFSPGSTQAPAGTAVFYPTGEEAPDILDEAKIKFLYQTATPLFIELPEEAQGTTLDFKLSMLMCSDAHCLPVTKRFSVEIPQLLPGSPKAENQDFWKLYISLRQLNNSGQALEELTPVILGQTSSSEPPGQTGLTDFSMESVLNAAPPPSPEVAEVNSWEITPRSALPGLEVQSLGTALLFGLLAGFILNFMPCMLPVIGLKLTAFMAADGVRQDHSAIRSFRNYWIFFSGGVISWFITLAFLVGTLNLLWGQAFQSGLLVLGMILVVFSLALSTFGFYTLPIISLRGNSSSPHQAFITGFLLTCLTTPCSGPLLGGVLAWTFRQGPEISSIVLISVGLGMVIPYLFLAAFPQLSRYCPRPGRWLVKLEILVGFFLLLTTAYLMSMLSNALLPWAVAMLVVMILVAFVVHHISKYHQEAHWKAFALSIFYLVTLAVAWRTLIQPADALESDWMPFTVAEFKENWGRKPIIMDFTADWCANCKVLENTVLTREKLLDWAERYDAVFIRADITHDNPAAQAMLQALDSASIPVVALFPANEQAASPVVLRDLFTTQQIEKAVRKTFR